VLLSGYDIRGKRKGAVDTQRSTKGHTTKRAWNVKEKTRARICTQVSKRRWEEFGNRSCNKNGKKVGDVRRSFGPTRQSRLREDGGK